MKSQHMKVEVGTIRSYQTLIGIGKNRHYRKKEYMEYAKEIGYQINHLKPMLPPYILTIHYNIKGNKRIDLTNATKVLEDILESHGIIDDDNNVISQHTSKTNGHSDNTIEITIKSVVGEI